MRNPNEVAFGQEGSKFIPDNSEHHEPPAGKVIVAVQAISAIDLKTSGTAVESGFEAPAQGTTIPAGVTVFGRFTKVQLNDTNQRAMIYFG
jgi:hypothetical protein